MTECPGHTIAVALHIPVTPVVGTQHLGYVSSRRRFLSYAKDHCIYSLSPQPFNFHLTTFNFLYSAGDQRSFHRGGSTTFQLAGTQTFDASAPTANLKTYDALAAQVVATTPTSFADVEMSHLFSLMKVTLKNKTGDAVNITKFEIEIPDENLYGIFNVIFGATPSTTLKSGQGDKITVNISNGTVAADGTLDVYFVMGPVATYTGEVTFTVTDSESNTYTKTNTISAPGVTFAAGTYNTANFSLKVAAPLYPTIDTSSSDYTTGFETGFTAGTTYNNTDVKVDGPDGGKWGSYFGTASTSDKITDSKSMQMRWYTGSSSSLGYAESNFFLSNVGFVSFNAKQTNGLKVGLYYKRASDGDWVLAQTFEPGTASTKCSYAFVTPIENARIKFGIVLPAKAPTSTSKLTIDDVVVKRVAPSYTVTIDGGITHGTVSTSPSGSVLEGAEVTITATPEDGYALTSLSVTDALSQAVTVTANKFTMPGSNVTVTATFAKLSSTTTALTMTSRLQRPSQCLLMMSISQLNLGRIPELLYQLILLIMLLPTLGRMQLNTPLLVLIAILLRPLPEGPIQVSIIRQVQIGDFTNLGVVEH